MKNWEPILFTTLMILAIIKGWKTMTRRVLKAKTSIDSCEWVERDKDGNDVFNGDGFYRPVVKATYQPGDVLWVRETHYRYGHWEKNGTTKTGKQKWEFVGDSTEVRYFDNPPEHVNRVTERTIGWYKRPAIHMPMWACRLWLRVNAVRVERVQEISEGDAIREGIYLQSPDFIPTFHYEEMKIPGQGWTTAKECFQWGLWDSINAARGYGWDVNPWVRVISFERIERPEGWPGVGR